MKNCSHLINLKLSNELHFKNHDDVFHLDHIENLSRSTGNRIFKIM